MSASGAQLGGGGRGTTGGVISVAPAAPARRASLSRTGVADVADASAPDAGVLPAVAAETIYIGDAVCLASGSEDGAFLCSTQSFKPKAFVRHPKTKALDNFHAAVFEIHVPFEYRNQKRYNEIKEEQKKLKNQKMRADQAQEKHGKEKQRLLDAGRLETDPRVQAEERKIKAAQKKVSEIHMAMAKLEHEENGVFSRMQQDNEDNKKEQQRKAGVTPLVYGDMVQLKHKYTDFFLAGSTVKTAVLEFNTLEVHLQEHSDSSCRFYIKPRFKVRGEGDEVKSGDQIILESVKAAGHYLYHSAVRFSEDAGLDGLLNAGDFEVSLSAVDRPWSIQVYTACKSAAPADSLHAGDVIQLFDREKDGYLSGGRMVPVHREEHGVATPIPADSATPALIEMPYLNSGKDEDKELKQESMSYWQVYLHNQHEVGAPLSFHVQKVVLRHMVTGKFLAVDNQSIVQHGSPTVIYKAIMVDSPGDARAVFRIADVDAHGSHVTAGTFCRLQNILTGAFFHTSTSKLSALDLATYEQGKAKGEVDDDVFDEKKNVNFRSQLSFEDAFVIKRVSEDKLDDFNEVSGYLPVLKLIQEATMPECSQMLPSQTATVRDGAAAFRSQLAYRRLGHRLIALGAELFAELANFLVDQEEDDDENEWGKSRYDRQGLCQDLGVLDVIIATINGPIRDIERDILTLNMFPELGSREESDNLLWNNAFVALKKSAEGKETATDRYIARHFQTFLTHSMYLKTHGSAELLIELYNGNRDALDDILAVDSRLDWVLEHLDKRENSEQDFIDHDFYNFLSTLCVCNDLSVHRAQSRIFAKLHAESSQLLDRGHFCQLVFVPRDDGTQVVVRMDASKAYALKDMIQTVPGTGTQHDKDKGEGGQSTIEYFEMRPRFEDDFLFLKSNIKLLSALCEGHDRAHAALVHKAMPPDVLIVIMRDRGVPFGLRSAAADVLYELVLDTRGALPVLSRKEKRAVFMFEVKSEKLTDVPVLDLPQWRQLNADRVQYAKDFHKWLIRAGGFEADLVEFMIEMRRLLDHGQKFQEHHREHGKFLTEVLRAVNFLVESGMYLAWQELKELLALLTRGMLVYAEDIITTADAKSEADKLRDAVIAEVTKECLKVFQLAQVHEAQSSMDKFFDDYVRLQQWRDSRKGPSLDSHGLSQLLGVKALFSEDPSTEPHFNKPFEKNVRAPVMSYLRSHFHKSSLSTRCNFKEIVHEAFKAKAAAVHKWRWLRFQCGQRNLEDMLMEIVKRGDREENDEYELESNIVQEGMTLLEQMFSREVELFRCGVRARVVVSPASQQRAAEVNKLMQELRYIAEDTQIDTREAAEVSRIVNALADALVTTEGDPLFTFQDIVFKQGALDVVLSVFDQTLDDDDLQDDVTGSEKALQNALVNCLRFVQLQTRGHKLAQEKMFEEMLSLLDNKNTRPTAVTAALALALSEIFSNSDLQSKLRGVHIDKICSVMFEKLGDSVHVAELLDLLSSTAKNEVGGQAVTRNQVLIVSALMQREEIVLGVLKRGEASSEQEREELAAMLSAPETDAQYRYHIALVRLLAVLGEGQSEYIESICKKIYSFNYLLDALNSPQYCDRRTLFASYLLFLDKIYLSDNCILPLEPTQPINTDPRMWRILEHVADEIEFLESDGLTKETAEYFFGGLILVASAFFRKFYNPAQLEHAGDAASAYEAVLSAGAVRKKCESIVIKMTMSLTRMHFSSDTMRGGSFWTRDNRKKVGGLVAVLLRSTDLPQQTLQDLMSDIEEQSNLTRTDLLKLGPSGLASKLSAAPHSAPAPATAAVVNPTVIAPRPAMEGGDEDTVFGFGDDSDDGDGVTDTGENGGGGGGKHAVKETAFGFGEEALVTGDSIGLFARAAPSESTTLAHSSAARRAGSMSAEKAETLDAAFREESLTNAFQRYVKTMWVMYSNQNIDEGHECQEIHYQEEDEKRNEFCYYLTLLRGPQETVLPCGHEFQRKIRLFSVGADGAEVDNNIPGYQTLIRYLKLLQEAIADVSSTDDDKEIARDNCVLTLNLLSAIMHRFKCDSFKGDDYHEKRDSQARVALMQQSERLQTRMALASAVDHCINLMADEDDEVMRAAWRFFVMLLDSCRRAVLDLLHEALKKQKSSKSLTRIRDELVRGVDELRQLQSEVSRELASADSSDTGHHTIGGQSTLSGTLTKDQIGGAIQNHFNTVTSRTLSIGSFSSAGTGANDERQAKEDAEKHKEKHEDVQRWVLDIAKGIQHMAEGAHTPNQDWLREQTTPGVISVNFVAELCKALGRVYMGIGQGPQWQRKEWLELIDQLLDSITELCQGNQKNQEVAINNQIIKMLNYVIAYDSNEEAMLTDLTKTKRAALTVLEAMLELNNDKARKIAKLIVDQLNQEELYLAMNRFYYIDFYMRKRPKMVEELIKEHDKVDKIGDLHIQAGREAYYILARIEDLTGQHYQWEKRKKDEIEKQLGLERETAVGGAEKAGGGFGWGIAKGVVGVGAAGIAGLSKTVKAAAGLPGEEKANKAKNKSEDENRLEEFEKLDKALEENFSSFRQKLEDKIDREFAAPGRRSNSDKKKKKFALSLYGEFCREFLFQLDRHGGHNIGTDCDRFEFFKIQTRSIEFLRDGQLQKVYFNAPKTQISATVRSRLQLEMSHASPQDKLRDFLNNFKEIRKDLSYQTSLRSNALTWLIAEGTGPYWKLAALIITYAINILMLAAYTAPYDPDDPEPTSPRWFNLAVYALGSVHVFLSLVIAGEYLVNNFSIPPSIEATYYMMFVTCSILGLFFQAYFFAFHTLHIVHGNDILQRAIESITRNGVALLSVTFLAVTVVYLFAVVAFLLFRGDFDHGSGQYCDTLLECFVTTLTWGLTHGGGTREAFGAGNGAGYFDDSHYLGRVGFDLLFWALIAVIMMNLILGIIVDTFSELRSERDRNTEEIKNFCFICSLPSHAFDEASGGFQHHYQREHNMWDYVYYSMYLTEVDASERNFNEAYLHKHFVEEPSTVPFPLKRALRVKAAGDDARSKMDALTARLEKLEAMLSSRFKQVDQAAAFTQFLEEQEEWRRQSATK